MTHLAIHGAAGRMGQRLVALTLEDAKLALTAAVEGPGNPRLGEDAGVVAGARKADVAITDAVPPGVAVNAMIDFSLPVGTRAVTPWCVKHAVPLVVGTTGLTADDEAMLDEAAKTIPLLKASNFSLVVNVLNLLAAKAAQLLGGDYDIEILEAHHRFKKDAPSGTALGIAESITIGVREQWVSSPVRLTQINPGSRFHTIEQPITITILIQGIGRSRYTIYQTAQLIPVTHPVPVTIRFAGIRPGEKLISVT